MDGFKTLQGLIEKLLLMQPKEARNKESKKVFFIYLRGTFLLITHLAAECISFTFPFIKLIEVLKLIVVLLIVVGFVFTPFSLLWAHAEKAYYLQGKVGEKTIAIKMLCYDETPAIRYIQYFFTTDRRDRYLAGKPEDGTWRFAADVQVVSHFPKPEGTLTIAENGSNWQGSFTDNQGKKQAIVLTPIAAEFIPAQFSQLPLVQEMDPYEKYRLATLRFTKNKTETFTNGLVSNWYVEPESGITFFRLGWGSTQVNTALEATHLMLVQQYFAYAPQKNYARPVTQLLYLTNELVSFRTVATSRLLTLTTTQTLLATTLDAATGEKLPLEDLIWFDKTLAKPTTGDFFALFQYRKKVAAPHLFQLLQTLHPQQIKTERCGINQPASWNLPAWNLTQQGLALAPNIADDCEAFKWAIIPYKSLQPFTEKKYHLQP